MRQSKPLLLFLIILLSVGIFNLKAFARKLFLGEVPVAADTIITSSSLQAAGFDTSIFSRLDERIAAGNYGLLHSLLVVYDNKLVVEKYYNKWEEKRIHDIQSATKSIASALIGIAIDKKFIRSVNEKLPDLLPDYDFRKEDSLKKSIRLKDLLTMSPGFAWDETTKYKEKGNSLTDMYASNINWLDYILTQDMTDKPGTRFNYNSGASILLGAILKAKTGMTVEKFAETFLFEPLGIGKYHWSEYFGIAHCGGGLYLSSRDMAKIGNLFLNKGQYNGSAIISSRWVRDSFVPRFGVSNKIYYGYQWWMIGSVFDFEPIVYAAGNGWQFIIVIKEFNTVIVTTGNNYVEQDPKTTLSQHELIYSILACNPAFRAKINRIFNDGKQVETRNFYEILLMAQALNSQGEYAKSVKYLKQVEVKYKNDLRFCYLAGEAYHYTGNNEKARIYLENCVRLCNEKKFPEAGYLRMANDLLAL